MSVQDLMLGLMWAAVVVPACVLLVAMAGVAVVLPGFRDGDANGQMGKWSNGQMTKAQVVETVKRGQREAAERTVPHEVIDVMA